MSHARRMILSSHVNLLTIKYRDIMRAKTKTEERTRVAVVTAKTAGPRFAIEPPGSESESGSMAAASRTLSNGEMGEMESKFRVWGPSPVEQRERWKREVFLDVAERLIIVEYPTEAGKERKSRQARYPALMRSLPLPRAPGGV
jgi:hypothetical protein